MSIPFIFLSDIPAEAESLCCSLVASGIADVVGSEDTDVLLYNQPLLRNLTSTDVEKRPISMIDGREVMEGLGLDISQWIDFGLMCGTDFTSKPVKG
jgi:flap endonuclease-1